MKIFNKILYFLIYIYIMLMPTLPGKYKIKSIPVNGDSVLALIILVYLILILFYKSSRNKFVHGIKNFFTHYLTLFISILILIMFISVSYSVDKKLALGETLRFCSYIALFFIIKYEVSRKKILDNILRCYIFVCDIICIIGIKQFFLSKGIIKQTSEGELLRIVSTLENPNNLGMFLILAIFPITMLVIYEKDKIKRTIYGLSFVLILSNIILSFSRNAWLGLAVGFVLIAITISYKLLIPIVAACGLSLFIPKIAARVQEFTDLSQNISRIKIWKVTSYMIKDNPFKGVGIGNFQKHYDEYVKLHRELEYHVETYVHPHNCFLKYQAELGIFGLLAFIGMFISFFTRIKEFVKHTNIKFYLYFYKGFAISLCVFLTMNLIDNFFSTPKVMSFLWILLSIPESMMYNRTNKEIFD